MNAIKAGFLFGRLTIACLSSRIGVTQSSYTTPEVVFSFFPVNNDLQRGMIFSSPSEFKAQQMVCDFLNSTPPSVNGQEFADRILELSKKMAHRRIKGEDWNIAVQIIRQHYRIGDEQWGAVVEYLRRATEQKSPIIISDQN